MTKPLEHRHRHSELRPEGKDGISDDVILQDYDASIACERRDLAHDSGSSTAEIHDEV